MFQYKHIFHSNLMLLFIFFFCLKTTSKYRTVRKLKIRKKADMNDLDIK